MRIRGRRGEIEEAKLNLTSMIDCVFLLLIFFVATMKAPKLEANIQAYLPKTDPLKTAGASTEEPMKEEANVIEIALRRGGGDRVEILLNGAEIVGGFSRLSAALGSLRFIAETTPGARTEVIVDATDVVAYKHIVTTLDICARHKFENVAFAMPPDEKTGTP